MTIVPQSITLKPALRNAIGMIRYVVFSCKWISLCYDEFAQSLGVVPSQLNRLGVYPADDSRAADGVPLRTAWMNKVVGQPNENADPDRTGILDSSAANGGPSRVLKRNGDLILFSKPSGGFQGGIVSKSHAPLISPRGRTIGAINVESPVYTTEKLAEILDLTEYTIRKHARTGALKGRGKKIGKRWYFPQSALADLLEAKAQEG